MEETYIVANGELRIVRPLVTVVIPAYNAANTISRCIESIIGQTYPNIEVIIVDDGSSEESQVVYNKIVQKKENIKYICQKNQGAAAARNNGVQNARGEYIIFVDADDYWCDMDMVSKLVTIGAADDCDFIIFYFNCLKEGATQLVRSQKEDMDPQKFEDLLNGEKKLYIATHCNNIISPCGKLIKRKYIIDNRIEFPNGRLREDIDWALQLLLQAKRVSALHEDVYTVVRNKSSTSFNVKVKDCEDLLWVIQKWVHIADEIADRNEKKAIYSILCFQFFIIMGFSEMLDKRQKKEMQKDLKKFQFLIKYSYNTKTHLCKYLTYSIPFAIACWVIKTYISR